jgi:hypothetical protein
VEPRLENVYMGIWGSNRPSGYKASSEPHVHAHVHAHTHTRTHAHTHTHHHGLRTLGELHYAQTCIINQPAYYHQSQQQCQQAWWTGTEVAARLGAWGSLGKHSDATILI